MDYFNPLEIILLILLSLLSVWIFERIVTGAFKTVLFGLLLFIGVFIYSLYHENSRKKFQKPSMRFSIHDLTDFDSFHKKIDFYKTETIKDVKLDFNEARKNLKKE